MSANHPNSLWDKHRRGRQGPMSEIGGPAWNRYLMEHDGGNSADYIAQFRHIAIRKARTYYRGALIRS